MIWYSTCLVLNMKSETTKITNNTDPDLEIPVLRFRPEKVVVVSWCRSKIINRSLDPSSLIHLPTLSILELHDPVLEQLPAISIYISRGRRRNLRAKTIKRIATVLQQPWKTSLQWVRSCSATIGTDATADNRRCEFFFTLVEPDLFSIFYPN